MSNGTINDVRQSILLIAQEIETLAGTATSAEAFYPEFLSRMVIATGADAAAIWLRDEKQGLRLGAEHRFAATGLIADDRLRAKYQKVLERVLQTGQAHVHRPGDTIGPGSVGNLVVIGGPLLVGNECIGVVQLFRQFEVPDEARPGYLQFIEQMCGHAARLLRRLRDPRPATGIFEAPPPPELTTLIEHIHGSLDSHEVAAVSASDCRQYLGCDRVSIAVAHGPKTIIKAISGQDTVNQRANLVRAMARLSGAVAAYGERLTYAGNTANLPTQIADPLADYLHESRSRMVFVVPLVAPEPLLDPKKRSGGESRPEATRQTLGTMIIEQVSESQVPQGLSERLDLIAPHVASALWNARSHENVFLLPLWRFIGRQLAWFRGRNLAQTIAVTALLIAGGVALAVVPWDYRVEAKGQLMPVVRRHIFAPWEGDVFEVLVGSGQLVKKDQVLVRLKNEELSAKLLAARSELTEKQKLLLTLQAELDEAVRGTERAEELKIQGKLVQTRIEVDSATEQVGLLQKQSDALIIRAPIDGVVATFQVDQLLLNRPVRRGEVLLDVMDDTGPWHLELEVPEQRMGHLLRAEADIGSGEIPVEYVLATETESTYHGWLQRSATRAILSEDEGAVVELNASLGDEGPIQRRIGAQVTAKINCGKRSLGYALFGDVIEFVRKQLWL